MEKEEIEVPGFWKFIMAMFFTPFYYFGEKRIAMGLFMGLFWFPGVILLLIPPVGIILLLIPFATGRTSIVAHARRARKLRKQQKMEEKREEAVLIGKTIVEGICQSPENGQEASLCLQQKKEVSVTRYEESDNELFDEMGCLKSKL